MPIKLKNVRRSDATLECVTLTGLGFRNRNVTRELRADGVRGWRRLEVEENGAGISAMVVEEDGVGFSTIEVGD